MGPVGPVGHSGKSGESYMDDAALFSIGHVAVGGRWTLTTLLGEFLYRAEQRYGPRHEGWTILGVEFRDDEGSPNVWYPGTRRHVAVRLSKEAKFNFKLAAFQLAHETIHLLAPNGGGKATVLEEGVAVMFADQMAAEFSLDAHQNEEFYIAARNAVADLIGLDKDAIKTLRQRERAFFRMTPPMIMTMISGCPASLAERLCETI